MDTDQKAPTGPLADIRVVEMGTLIAGPFCGQVLGDFGAEVIKIEDPAAGDPMRGWGRSMPKGHSPWWPVIGRNKKSITLNLRTQEGQDLARKLIDKSDVLVENFRPGTLEKWGLGYEALSKTNPGLILNRASGYGQTGPMSHKAGYALVGEAMGGLRYITGEPDRPPARAGISIGDSLAGLHGALGVMMALHARQASGRGQVIDVSIYESVLTVMENAITEYDLTGYVRERSGSILPGIAPSNAYPTLDAMVVIGANQDTLFSRLCEVMKRPDLAADPRYKTHLGRGENQKELDDIIGAWTATQTTDAVLALMDEYGIAAGRVYRPQDMMTDPQYQARESIVSVPHPVFGQVKMQNVFPKMSETPGSVRWPGEGLGAHTDEVLMQVADLSADEVADLRKRGIV